MTAATSPETFAGLAEQLEAALHSAPRLSLTPHTLDPEFAERGSPQGLSLRAWALDLSAERPLAQLRGVRILGPKLDVLNLMAFPAEPDALPIFAGELLAFGGAARIAFIDLQDAGLVGELRRLGSQATARVLRGLSAPPREAPEWAVEASLGHPYFVRGDGSSDLAPAFRDAWQAYAEAWVALAEVAAEAPEQASPDLAALSRYKSHHVTHSPGTGFLARAFGEDWARRFQTEFLYA